MAELALRFFGPPQVERDGEAVELSRRKALALLAYLALSERGHTREALAALLWPEFEPAAARGELRRVLSTLRRALGEGWVEADRETVALRRGARLSVDVERFRALRRECARHGHPSSESCAACLPLLSEAAHIARGDFLEGFTLADAPKFDEWQRFEGESLRRELADTLERLARGVGADGDAPSLEQAIAHARRWLALDSLNESAHRLLMTLYARKGERQAALQHYRDCVRLLQSELGVAPSEETSALFERIRAGEVEGASRSAPTASDSPRSNLPLSVTPFVGREAELREISARLASPGCRLLTLTGVGGMGKTRLALEGARRLLAEGAFPDGGYLVDLAAIDSPAFLVSAIASALGLTFQGSADPKQQLLEALRERETLLLLDNCEHLLDGATLFSELVERAPTVKLLATSRERLALRGEVVVPLDGLPVPDEGSTEALDSYAALRLFVQSAQRVERDFALAATERADAIRICRLVHGIPLGIELAASWVRTLSCREIAEEIERDLDFLALSMRDMPERHRGMRAVFQQSWRLLAGEERQALRRLTLFRGGFDRAAAERVAGCTLRQLASLLDKSLLRREAGQRFSLHEMIRQFAAEKLAAHPDEEAEARARHRAYFGRWVEERLPALRGGSQKETLEEFQSELENVRLGWQQALGQPEPEEALRFLEGLFRFYEMRGWYREGESTFATAAHLLQDGPGATASPGISSRSLLPRVLSRQASFCFRLDRYEETEALLQRALRLFEEGGEENSADVAFCLHTLGNLSWMTGEYESAKRAWEESLAIRRVLGEPVEVSNTLNNLGIFAADTGEIEEAVRYYQEVLTLKRALGDRMGTANTLNNLGHLLMQMDDLESATQRLTESLSTQEEAGTKLGRGQALFNLGWVAYKRGEHEAAEARFRESLAVSRELGNRGLAIYPLADLARVARARGEREAASRHHLAALRSAHEQAAMPALMHALVGAVEWLHDAGETTAAIEVGGCALQQRALNHWNRRLLGEALDKLAAELPPERFSAALERGKERSLDEVVERVVTLLGPGIERE